MGTEPSPGTPGAADEPPGAGTPRTSLSREAIVTAALTVASRVPGPGLSLRALGRELGCDPTAVYRHVRDKDDLVEACLDRLMSRVVAAVPADAPWRARLTAAAGGYLEQVVAHPAIGAQAGHRTTGGPGELAMLELVLGALVDAGLAPHDAVRYEPLVAGYAAAMAASQAAYRLHDDRITAAAERSWVRPPVDVDPARFPHVAALRAQIAELRDADVVLAGFELLLDGVEAAAERARG